MASKNAAPTTGLDLDSETKRAIVARLRRVEGQVGAIVRMIESDRDCHAIAQQMGAAKSALERATVQLMASSFVSCLRPNGRGVVDQRELARLTDTFVKILG